MNHEAIPARRPRFLKFLDALLEKFLRGLLPEERRYLVLVPIVGVLAGVVAVGLENLLHVVQTTCWGDSTHTSSAELSVLEAAEKLREESNWIHLVGIPTLGGIVVVASLFLLRNVDRFHGTAGLIESLAFKKGRLQFLKTIAESLVSITAVGTGASLGREGAMVHSGAALGSWIATKFRLADHHVKILLASGAAGGMAAAYNAPIGATIFAMEVLLGSFALELFGPIILCSVLSTTVAHVLFQTEPVYDVETYTIAGEWEILLDLGMGAILGLVSVLFIRVFSGINVFFRWLEPIGRFRPVVAMFILGVVGISFPELFGNGYDTVNSVVNGRRDYAIQFLLLVPLLKILVTSLCRTGGVPGGLFTPSLFIGALLGYAFGELASLLLPSGSVSDPSIYALVGMGAILAGTLQAPITAILMIFELTRDYGFILPLMSACIASALVSHFFQAGSLYMEPLKRKGIYLPTASTPTWIRQPTVRTVLQPLIATVAPAERFKDLTDKFLRAPEGQDHLYVTNSLGVCMGVISLHDIKRFIQETDNLESVIAADLVDTSFPFVCADDPISRAIEILGELSFERLPVLDGPDTRRLLGTVSKRQLLVAYKETNLARQGNEAPREGERSANGT